MLKILVICLFIADCRAVFNSCEKELTCDDCIRNGNNCVWCAQENFEGTRCRSESEPEQWCTKLEKPRSNIDIGVNSAFNSTYEHVVQIRPQTFTGILKPGHSVNVTFSFKAAKDYPVDMYFLFSASDSNSKLKNIMAEQSEDIYKMMKGMTSDVYLGMGSFIDKNIIPFIDAVNNSDSYSFRHGLSLTDNFQAFKEAVENTGSGSSADYPDSGLDALAQVIVCEEVIKWRKESRRIVWYIADCPYHMAGDGRAAGIVKPYDGKCYTENNSYNNHELAMDYPSVSMIKKLAAKYETSIIFLVNNQRSVIYTALSKAIDGSKSKGYNAVSKKTIVQMLKDMYLDITQNIEFKIATSNPEHQAKVKLTVDPDCNAVGCFVRHGEEKQFTATLTLLEYFEGPLSIDLSLPGIKDKLTITLNAIGECSCRREKSNDCEVGYSKHCGICECDNFGLSGTCNCPAHLSTATCNPNGDMKGKLCSDHGSCKCGTCHCNEGFEGSYCECSKLDCPRSVGAICNNKGKCKCGKCLCDDDWSGDACQCSKRQDECLENGKLCNGRGICKCNSCQCDRLESWDARLEVTSRSTCSLPPCPQCHERQCRAVESCALCHHLGHSCNDACHVSVTANVTNLKEMDDSWRKCGNIPVSLGCYTGFWYKYKKDVYGINVLVQSTVDCGKTYYWIGGTVGLIILLAGMGAIVGWKVVTYIKDRGEYNRFKSALDEGTAFSDNDLYCPPTTTFKNPRFGSFRSRGSRRSNREAS